MNPTQPRAFHRLMRCACLLLVALTGCGSTADQLPVIGVVGDRPPEANTVLVEIAADGSFVVDGTPFDASIDESVLEQALAAASAGMPTRGFEPLGDDATVSSADVLVRAQRDAPAVSVWRLLGACSGDVRLSHPRIFFEVRHPTAIGSGALAWFLPYDRGGHVVPADRWIELRLPAGELRLDAANLATRIRTICARTPKTTDVGVSIVVAAETRLQLVLDAADATFRAGLAPEFWLPRDDVPDHLALRVDLDPPEPLAPGVASDANAPPRVRGQYAGVADLWLAPVDPREAPVGLPEEDTPDLVERDR